MSGFEHLMTYCCKPSISYGILSTASGGQPAHVSILDIALSFLNLAKSALHCDNCSCNWATTVCSLPHDISAHTALLWLSVITISGSVLHSWEQLLTSSSPQSVLSYKWKQVTLYKLILHNSRLYMDHALESPTRIIANAIFFTFNRDISGTKAFQPTLMPRQGHFQATTTHPYVSISFRYGGGAVPKQGGKSNFVKTASRFRLCVSVN